MDKKNTAIGIILAVAAIAWMYWSEAHAPHPPELAPAAATAQQAPTAPASSVQTPGTPASSAPAAQGSEAPAAPAASKEEFAVLHSEPAASITTLENDFIAVHFTDFGGAISDVALKHYAATQDKGSGPFIINELHSDPMLAFVGLPGLDRSTKYALVSKSASEVVYRAVFKGQLEVTRRYTLSPDKGGTTDPYQVRAETTFRNLTAKPLPPMTVALAVGTARPLNERDSGIYIDTGYSTGSDQTFIRASQLAQSSGFLGSGMGAHDALPQIDSPGPIVWATVINQFFGSILTSDSPISAFVTRRVQIPAGPDLPPNPIGVTGDAQFSLASLPAHGTATLGGNLYAGPKEYHRLSNTDVFKANQDRIMQFGWFRFFSALLETLMLWMHAIVSNWGVDIILMTLILKLVTLPLTLASSRSMKRMQKLTPQIKAIKEKYKDNSQKLQEATFALYKEHKVNPLGGCIPMVITLPFFYGFYRMLYYSAELRFQSFLWARDLSSPDTVGHVFGFPINPLALLLGIVMLLQMRFTPQPVTADKSQAQMAKFTPLIFVVFCYTYSCALSLYYSTNTIFSILQQWLVNRSKGDGDPMTGSAAAPKAGGPGKGKAMKNITPARKR